METSVINNQMSFFPEKYKKQTAKNSKLLILYKSIPKLFKSCYAFKIVPNCYRNNHAQFHIDKTILSCLKELSITQFDTISITNKNLYLQYNFNIDYSI